MEQIGIGLLIGIISAFLSSWITVQLSLSQFRSEKWWEKRVDAYSKVIEALYNSKIFIEENLIVEAEEGNLTDARKKELEKRAELANDEILKAVNVGAFLLSENALDYLKQYKAETKTYPEMTWEDYLDQNYIPTKTCLASIIKIAKKDLSVNH